jgi:hypothetical protein
MKWHDAIDLGRREGGMQYASWSSKDVEDESPTLPSTPVSSGSFYRLLPRYCVSFDGTSANTKEDPGGVW